MRPATTSGGDERRRVAAVQQPWYGLGRPEKARDLYERALRIKEREYGPDHVEVAGALNNLGRAWSELGQPEKARDLYERALRIFYAHYPKGHPHRDLVV